MSDIHRRELSLLARSHMNSKCADCRRKAPGFASCKFGIFICHPCAEVHKELFPESHADIRSLLFDAWDASALATLVGNLKSNTMFEAKIQLQERILCDVDDDARHDFIRSKYIDRKWFNADAEVSSSSSLFGSPDDVPRVDPQSGKKISKREQRKRQLNQKASQCPQEAQEKELRRKRELIADRDSFDPTLAKLLLKQLFQAGQARLRADQQEPTSIEAPCSPVADSSTISTTSTSSASSAEIFPAASFTAFSSQLPELNERLSLILTTSAVPSNPSLTLIRGVLNSVEEHLGFDTEQQVFPTDSAPKRCLTLIMMDGYALDATLCVGTKPRYKNGKLDNPSIEAYESFKRNLRAFISTQPYPHLFLVPFELPFRHGFAGAVHQSLQFISTPYMFVLQHDWCFVRKIKHSVWQLLQLMEQNQPAVVNDDEAAQQEEEEEEEDDDASDSEEEAEEEKSAVGEEIENGKESESRSKVQGGSKEHRAIERSMQKMQLQAHRIDQPILNTTVATESTSHLSVASTADEEPSSSPEASVDDPSVSPSTADLLANAVNEPLGINYITFQSITTVKYLEKDFHCVAPHVGRQIFRMHNYPLQDCAITADESSNNSATVDGATDSVSSSAASSTSSSLCTDPIPLCPIFFWFDRNHLVRTSFYRRHVFGSYRFMRSAAFIEDTFGQIMLNMLRGTYHGEKRFRTRTFAHYAAFIYYADEAVTKPHLDHVHGRKYLTKQQHAAQYGAALASVSVSNKRTSRRRVAAGESGTQADEEPQQMRQPKQRATEPLLDAQEFSFDDTL